MIRYIVNVLFWYQDVKITHENLFEYQLKQIKEKRENDNIKYNSQSEKLITNLGNDSNCYLNFELYQMMKDAGYLITIKKILKSKHEAIFKEYIEYLYSKKENNILYKRKRHLSLFIKF